MNAKLGDPEFEPTDEDLRALSRAAFADAEARHQAALAHLFQKIAAARKADRQTRNDPNQ